MQQSELQRGGTERRVSGGWFENLYGFVVLPLADCEVTEDRNGIGIRRTPAARFGLGLAQLAVRDCRPGARRERTRGRRLLRRRTRGLGRAEAHGKQDDDQGPHPHREAAVRACAFH